MPHYPDEVEYSDKYMDDFYEYRHVILPRDIYKKAPRGRLLLENVRNSLICRNGEDQEFSKVEVGSIMRFINLNPIFCSLGDPEGQTHRLGSRLLGSLPLRILLPTDQCMPIILYSAFFSSTLTNFYCTSHKKYHS